MHICQLHSFDSCWLAHLITIIRVIFISNKSLPVPMLLPHPAHLFNGDPLCLRQEEVYEDGHNKHEEREEEEETEFQVAQHCQEDLSHNESEDHVD